MNCRCYGYGFGDVVMLTGHIQCSGSSDHSRHSRTYNNKIQTMVKVGQPVRSGQREKQTTRMNS
ncbi:hypothetical protein R6Q59_010310 [Mikania micrantha]